MAQNQVCMWTENNVNVVMVSKMSKPTTHNVPNLLLGLSVVVLIPRQLFCGLWLADTPIADYHGPIAGQHTTWRGKSTTTWSPATQMDPCEVSEFSTNERRLSLCEGLCFLLHSNHVTIFVNCNFMNVSM